MAVGYRNSAGIDFDALFQPGDLQAPGFRKADGTNLRYAPRGSTPKIPDVGYRDELGSDLSNLWMALVAVSDGGLPADLESFRTLTSSAGGSIACSFTFGANGVVTWNQVGVPGRLPGTGTWVTGGSSAASQYEVRYTTLSNTGGGALVGADSVWRLLNVDRAVSLTATLGSGAGEAIVDAVAVVRIEIRRQATSAVVLNRTIGLEAIVERIA